MQDPAAPEPLVTAVSELLMYGECLTDEAAAARRLSESLQRIRSQMQEGPPSQAHWLGLLAELDTAQSALNRHLASIASGLQRVAEKLEQGAAE